VFTRGDQLLSDVRPPGWYAPRRRGEVLGPSDDDHKYSAPLAARNFKGKKGNPSSRCVSGVKKKSRRKLSHVKRVRFDYVSLSFFFDNTFSLSSLF
jgi:hypothetical protein